MSIDSHLGLLPKHLPMQDAVVNQLFTLTDSLNLEPDCEFGPIMQEGYYIKSKSGVCGKDHFLKPCPIFHLEKTFASASLQAAAAGPSAGYLAIQLL